MYEVIALRYNTITEHVM